MINKVADETIMAIKKLTDQSIRVDPGNIVKVKTDDEGTHITHHWRRKQWREMAGATLPLTHCVVLSGDIDQANARIAELEAQVAEMTPLVEAVEAIQAKLTHGDAGTLNAYCDDDFTAKYGDPFDHITAYGATLAAALIALAKVIGNEEGA